MAFFLGLLLVAAPALAQRPLHPDYPDPRIVLVGPTGSGKSSLGKALLGCDPRDKGCLFPVCPGHDSCTSSTDIGTGLWLGKGKNMTVVDTPGFGDSNGEDVDEAHMEEMMDTLANVLIFADTILLVLPGETERFDESLQRMLKRMELMFGKKWWDFMVVGVSKWAYDQASIDARNESCSNPDYPEYCRDEAWFANNVNSMLNQVFTFNPPRNFSFVFADSFSQKDPENIDDALQQEHWQIETGKLWNITINREETFPFLTINDILEENARQRAEIKWLNDVITNNISQLMKITSSNTESIEAANIRIDVEQDHIVAIEDKIEDLNLTPIGTIIAWITHVTEGNITELPEGWMRCDGSTIGYPSIWEGKLTPNLNGDKRFLRGGTDGACLTMEEEQTRLINHKHDITDKEHQHGLTDPGHVHDVNDVVHKHDITDTGHIHIISDGTHTHTVTDNGHNHVAKDEGHTHTYEDWYDSYDHGNGDCACNAGQYGTGSWTGTTSEGKSSIKVDDGNADLVLTAALSNLTVNSVTTGIKVDSVITGITVKNGKSRINVNKATSGINVELVTSDYIDATTIESRPKNMNVIYIIRVW